MNIKKILIVDDEENIRSLLDSFLSSQGYQIRLAKDGDEALQMVKKEIPDLVFLDIKLPGKNGVEVLRMIREFDSNISVVMISGNATEDTAKETLNLGAFDYIKKPVDLDKVSEIISCVDLVNFEIL